MSIESRIEEAIILQQIGRFEGALTSVLIAVASTSRLRRPQGSASETEAFTLFLQEEHESIYGTECNMQGTMPIREPHNPTTPARTRTIPNILYRYLRCTLVHEAGVPSNIGFVESSPNILSMSYDHTSGKFIFSTSWLERLIDVVVYSSENSVRFKEWLHHKAIRINALLRCKLSGDQCACLRRQLKGVKTKFDLATPLTFEHRLLR